MARNPERRTALLDAAISTLAEHGARGLTFRAVDARAGVPAGTSSNYFVSRDDLLSQTSVRTYERFMPDQATWELATTGPHDRGTLETLMRETVGRLVAHPEVFLATLELRLEATRQPRLRTDIEARVRADLEANVAFHESIGMPGGRDAVVTLYLALNWLIVDHLTLPGVLEDEGALDAIVTRVVRMLDLSA